MLTINSKALKIGNKWLNPVNGSGPTPPSTTYYVTTSGSHGSVVASPTEGTTGTEVTLSNTPDTHYHFDSYTITGATLKNANQFDIANSDVSVVGNFLEDTRYTVTVNQSTGGTISASPVQGYTGTEVTLSNTPDTGYEFDSYTLTGATLKNSNQFDIANSNVTVVGNFRTVVTYDHYEIQIVPEVSSSTCYAAINDMNIRPYSGYVRRSATRVDNLSESDLDNMVDPNNTYVIAITRSVGLFLLFDTLPANGITWYDTPVAYPTYWQGTVSGYLYGVDSDDNRTLLDSYGPTANKVHGMHTLGA